jgi:hypothetical protein
LKIIGATVQLPGYELGRRGIELTESPEIAVAEENRIESSGVGSCRRELD